eukprot:s965_g17.t1
MGMGGAGLGRQSGFSAKRAVRTRNLQKYFRNVEKCCAPATSLHESSSWAGGPPPWYAWCAEKAGQEGTGEAKNPRGVRTVSTGVDATSAEASVTGNPDCSKEAQTNISSKDETVSTLCTTCLAQARFR